MIRSNDTICFCSYQVGTTLMDSIYINFSASFPRLLLSIYSFCRCFFSFLMFRVHFCPFYICSFLFLFLYFLFFLLVISFRFSSQFCFFFCFHSRLFCIQIFSSYFILLFSRFVLKNYIFFLDSWWVFFAVLTLFSFRFLWVYICVFLFIYLFF